MFRILPITLILSMILCWCGQKAPQKEGDESPNAVAPVGAKRIKIFSDGNRADLEASINNWITQEEPEIIEIKPAPDGSTAKVTVVIYYKVTKTKK